MGEGHAGARLPIQGCWKILKTVWWALKRPGFTNSSWSESGSPSASQTPPNKQLLEVLSRRTWDILRNRILSDNTGSEFYVGDWNWKMEQEKESSRKGRSWEIMKQRENWKMEQEAERVEVEKLWSRETAEWPCLPPRILNTVVLPNPASLGPLRPGRVLCPAHLVISAWPGDGCATHWLKKF